MRRVFLETLAGIAVHQPRVLLLTADLGFRAIEPFADLCPRQFFNVGVCEQNMVGLATGLAEAGFLPFVYSITPFAVLRPYEFIRNGPVAQRLPVRIVAVGGGFEYSTNGISHFGLDDIGVLRVQPGLPLIAPVDKSQAAAALQALWDLPTPMYFRISKDEREDVPGLGGRFTLGCSQTLRSGTDVLLLALGTAAFTALEAATLLGSDGLSAHVELIDNLNGPELKGLPGLLTRFPVAIAVEDHYINGGLGSLVCETAAELGIPCRVIRSGVRSVPDGISGSYTFLAGHYEVSARAIADRAVKEVRANR